MPSNKLELARSQLQLGKIAMMPLYNCIHFLILSYSMILIAPLMLSFQVPRF